MALIHIPTKRGMRRRRHDLTEAECRLWKHLRNHQLAGWAFRRQHLISPYIVDFACVEAQLVIEADGGQYAESGKDKARDDDLAKRNWRVLRFWNDDVLASTEGVVAQILASLAPTLTLPRA